MVTSSVVGGEPNAVPFESIGDPPSPAYGSLCEPCPGEAIVPAGPEGLMDASGRTSDGVSVTFMPGKLVEVYDSKLAGCESA